MTGFFKHLVAHILHIVPDEDTHARDTGHTHVMADLVAEITCRSGKLRFLFYIHTSDSAH